MKLKSDYTTVARRLSFQHPLLSALITQISFWCISFTVLDVITYLTSKGVTSLYSFSGDIRFMPILISSLVMGLFYALMPGITDFYLLRKCSKGKSLGRLILVTVLIYFITECAVCIYKIYTMARHFAAPILSRHFLVK